MAQLVRYVAQGGEPCVGVLTDAGVHTADVASIAELLTASGPALEQVVAAAAGRDPAHLREDVRLLAPVDGHTEVWGAGVTYARSRDARIEESDRADVYGLVYAADRPELFLKAAAWRVVGPGADIAVRADADDTVPEPELALVVDHAGTIVGYTICNDLTARSIEAANPLYLPQAKTYSRSCALGPGIVPAGAIDDPANLAIELRVRRGDALAIQAQTSTAQMRRGFTELVAWLTRELDFPAGAILATGTGIVPRLRDGVLPGDVVEIEIERIGVLSNPVAPA